MMWASTDEACQPESTLLIFSHFLRNWTKSTDKSAVLWGKSWLRARSGRGHMKDKTTAQLACTLCLSFKERRRQQRSKGWVYGFTSHRVHTCVGVQHWALRLWPYVACVFSVLTLAECAEVFLTQVTLETMSQKPDSFQSIRLALT